MNRRSLFQTAAALAAATAATSVSTQLLAQAASAPVVPTGTDALLFKDDPQFWYETVRMFGAAEYGGALFGEEDQERSLLDLVEALGIGDRVDFTGHVDDVAAELATLDVVVHASTIPEPFGQVVIEAMAAGVPIIAADAGGPAEVVTDGVDGLLVAMGDVDALAGALTRMAGDPELRDRLADAGRVTAAAFAPDVIAGSVEDVYRQVLDA